MLRPKSGSHTNTNAQNHKQIHPKIQCQECLVLGEGDMNVVMPAVIVISHTAYSSELTWGKTWKPMHSLFSHFQQASQRHISAWSPSDPRAWRPSTAWENNNICKQLPTYDYTPNKHLMSCLQTLATSILGIMGSFPPMKISSKKCR